MGSIRLVAASLLLLLVAPPPGRAVDAATCKGTILRRGTAFFNDVTALTARCVRAQLLTGDLSQNCPENRDAVRIGALGANASAAIDAVCAANPETAGCLDHETGLAFALARSVFGAGAPGLPNPSLRCLDAIGRRAVSLAKFRAQRLASCNQKVVDGSAGFGPAGPGCDGPTGTQAKIAAAEAAMGERLGAACGGPDRTAGTPDDLDPQTDLAFGATCPGGSACGFTIDTLPELIGCATCIAEERVATVSRGLAALPLDAATTCSAGVGSAFLELLDDDLRDLAACEDRVLAGQSDPCPDAETYADLVANEADYAAHVQAACGAAAGPPAVLAFSYATALTNLLYPTHAEEAGFALRRCKEEIGSSASSSTGYARRKVTRLQSCNGRRLCGQTSDPCPDSDTASSIASAAASASTGIHQRCDAFTPSDLGYGATCPVGSAGCSALPTTTIGELITCLQCFADEVADGSTALVF